MNIGVKHQIGSAGQGGKRRGRGKERERGRRERGMWGRGEEGRREEEMAKMLVHLKACKTKSIVNERIKFAN